MTRFKINRLISGGLITNYSCTSRCGHCLYNCGPFREKEYINGQSAEKYLSQIRELGCLSVHIGGGEPMLYPDKLGDVLEAADWAGVSVEYVETNASWFQDLESASEILRKLRHRGLKTFLVSISPFHNEYIPYTKTAGVINACRETGIHVFPWKDVFIKDITMLDTSKTHSIDEYINISGDGYLKKVLENYWIHLGGRALDTFRPVLPSWTIEEIIAGEESGCAEKLSETSHFHFDLFGNYIPGLCSGLLIRHEDISSPLSKEQYPVMTLLADSGVKGLLDFAEDRFGFVPGKQKYINKCDLCMEIRAFLVTNDVDFLELGPEGFYRQESTTR